MNLACLLSALSTWKESLTPNGRETSVQLVDCAFKIVFTAAVTTPPLWKQLSRRRVMPVQFFLDVKQRILPSRDMHWKYGT